MTSPDRVDQLLRECAVVSDKLNNLLVVLMTKTADKYIANGLREISVIAEGAASYSAMLQRLSDKTNRT
jgi:hypothetical protein